MPEQLLKHFSIEIEQKLYAKTTPAGDLAVYQTTPFGMMLTLNGQIMISENDSFFYHEMLAHPALFSHATPKKVAIIGNSFGVLPEVLKHTSISHVACVSENHLLDETIAQYFTECTSAKTDARVQYYKSNALTWLQENQTAEFDIIIQSQHSDNFLQEHYQHYHRALGEEGILVQPCKSSLLQLKSLKPIYQNVKQAGFQDWQVLNFPQPSHAPGWRTIILATKRSAFKRVREKEIFNRPFATRYYNYDVHKAASVLPEFMRSELEPNTL